MPIIQEQSGALWMIRRTNAKSPGRAYWVFLVSGISAARPGVVGFYAASVNAAYEALAN